LLQKVIRSQLKDNSTQIEHLEEFLRDIVISSILAGREATSPALTWFSWLLSSRPNAEQKILEEIASVRARTGKWDTDTFEFDELREMQFFARGADRVDEAVPSGADKHGLLSEMMCCRTERNGDQERVVHVVCKRWDEWKPFGGKMVECFGRRARLCSWRFTRGRGGVWGSRWPTFR